jgi:hypothetical protein
MVSKRYNIKCGSYIIELKKGWYVVMVVGWAYYGLRPTQKGGAVLFAGHCSHVNSKQVGN